MQVYNEVYSASFERQLVNSMCTFFIMCIIITDFFLGALATSEWIQFFKDAGIPPGLAVNYAVSFVDNR